MHLSYPSVAAGALLGPGCVHHRHMFRRAASEVKHGMTIRVWKLQSGMHVGVPAEFLRVKEMIKSKSYENVYVLQATET